MAASPQDIQKLNERIVAIFTQFKEYEKKERHAMLLENVSTASEGINKVLEMTAKILEQEIKLPDQSSKSINNKNKQIKDILIAQAVLSGVGPIAKMAKNILSYQAAGLKAKSDYTMEMINNNPELYNEVQEEITGFKSKDELRTIIKNAEKAKKNAQQDNDKAALIDLILIAPIDEKIAGDAVNAAKKANQEAQQAWNDVDKKNSAYNTEKDKQKRIDTLKEISKLSGVIRKKAAEVQKQARIAETAEKAQGYRVKGKNLADATVAALNFIKSDQATLPPDQQAVETDNNEIKNNIPSIQYALAVDSHKNALEFAQKALGFLNALSLLVKDVKDLATAKANLETAIKINK